jgi:hypothetical protein
MRKKSLIILFLITVFGFILRYINLTQYNVYSDSYEFMLVAKNMVERLSLDGTLGKLGMYWGPLFYNRIGFGLFLAPFYFFIRDLEHSAHILSFIAGIISIPLIYLLAVKIFKKREIGLIAALLISISFSNVMLSGFIMANTLVVLFIILTLLCFWQAQDKGKWQWYLLSGILLALTCFIRAEILITLPAFIILILFSSRKTLAIRSGDETTISCEKRRDTTGFNPGRTAFKDKLKKHLLSFSLAFFATIGLLILKIYFFISNISLWWSTQSIYITKSISRYSLTILIFVLLLGLLVYFLKKKTKWFLERSTKFYALLILISLIFILIIPALIGRVYNWQSTLFSLRTDFLIIILGLSGLIFLFKKNFWQGLFSYLFIFPLLLIYFVFGGGGDFRHINLTSPVLIIVASFFIWQILSSLKAWLSKKQGWNYKLSMLGILLIIGLLFYAQFCQDLRSWHSRVSYEKEIGQSVNKIVDQEKIPRDTVIISSFPEAHYIYTGLSAWEQKKDKPYISDSLSDDQKILLVVDEGTRDNYPKLADEANKKLKPYALKSILSTVKYQYGSKIWWPKGLTNLYYLSAGEFRKLVSSD